MLEPVKIEEPEVKQPAQAKPYIVTTSMANEQPPWQILVDRINELEVNLAKTDAVVAQNQRRSIAAGSNGELESRITELESRVK